MPEKNLRLCRMSFGAWEDEIEMPLTPHRIQDTQYYCVAAKARATTTTMMTRDTQQDRPELL